MANLNLKTLEWEGLDNVYYVHEVADEYDPTQTYEAGEYCTYLGVTYRAKADISTAEAWTAAHWEATTVGEELTALNEQFEEFTGAVDSRITYRDPNNDGNVQILASNLGGANGVPVLDSSGKVPAANLPSYVDDVIDGYLYNDAFYTDSAHTDQITPEKGKIYNDEVTSKTYRWSGSAYIRTNPTDAGEVAYDSSVTYNNNTVGKELQNIASDIDNLSSTDVAHNASAETYTAGTVGAELASQSNRIDVVTNETKSLSGSVVTLDDGVEGAPLKSCVVNVTAWQEGTGDASPNNIRAIHGWSGCKLGRANELQMLIPAGTYPQTSKGITVEYLGSGKYHVYGTMQSGENETGRFSVNEFVILSAEPRLISFNNSLVSGTVSIILYDGNTTVEKWDFSSENRSSYYTAMVGKTVNAFSIFTSAGTTFDITFCVEITTALTKYTVQFGDTIYGGQYNYLTGLLTAGRFWAGTLAKLIDIGVGISYDSSMKRFVIEISGAPFKSGGYLACSMAPRNADIWSSNSNPSIGYYSNAQQLMLRFDGTTTTVSDLKANYGAAQLVWEIDQDPVTVQLTPSEVTLLAGSNTIWADCGDVSIEYGGYISSVLESANRYTDNNVTMYRNSQTKSGNPIEIFDGIDGAPVKNCDLTINGSGSVNVVRCGKNIFARKSGSVTNGQITVQWIDGILYASGGTTGNEVGNGSVWKSAGYVTLPAGTYRFILNETPNHTGSFYPTIYNYDTNGVVCYFPNSYNQVITLSAETKVYFSAYAYHCQFSKRTAIPLLISPVSSGTTAYEIQKTQFITVDISSAGTVTDGSLNLETGVLKAGGNTYNLAKNEMTLVDGFNYIYSDAGSISLEYGNYIGSLREYIDRKIAALS